MTAQPHQFLMAMDLFASIIHLQQGEQLKKVKLQAQGMLFNTILKIPMKSVQSSTTFMSRTSIHHGVNRNQLVFSLTMVTSNLHTSRRGQAKMALRSHLHSFAMKEKVIEIMALNVHRMLLMISMIRKSMDSSSMSNLLFLNSREILKSYTRSRDSRTQRRSAIFSSRDSQALLLRKILRQFLSLMERSKVSRSFRQLTVKMLQEPSFALSNMKALLLPD